MLNKINSGNKTQLWLIWKAKHFGFVDFFFWRWLILDKLWLMLPTQSIWEFKALHSLFLISDNWYYEAVFCLTRIAINVFCHYFIGDVNEFIGKSKYRHPQRHIQGIVGYEWSKERTYHFFFVTNWRTDVNAGLKNTQF